VRDYFRHSAQPLSKPAATAARPPFALRGGPAQVTKQPFGLEGGSEFPCLLAGLGFGLSSRHRSSAPSVQGSATAVDSAAASDVWCSTLSPETQRTAYSC
jgi:hypothetical protein